jgi:hypothetical protein
MITINTPGAAYEYEYKGLSTDEKPTDCAANSLFLELDTGKFYYFDGEAWNELGTGGGGGDGDVLYNGSVTFQVVGDPPEQASMSTAPLEFTRTPEDGEDAYMYVDGNQIGSMANWVYNGSDNYNATFMDGENPIGIIQYDDVDGAWEGTIILLDTSIVGEKTVEIRKTPKLT